MNQKEILQVVQEYAKKQDIKKYHLYMGIHGMSEYATELNLDNLSAAIVGGNFLRQQALIVPILPFIKFKNSEHYLGLVSTYSHELYHNKDAMISSLNINKELLTEFSTKNKELYFYSKNILEDKFSEVADIFTKVLAKKGLILKKKPSLAYTIDSNEIIDIVRIKNFNWIESGLTKTLEALQYNVEVNKYLGIESNVFDKCHGTTFTVNFIGVENEQLLDSFMDALLTKFIDCENDPDFLATAENMEKMVSYTLLEHELGKKEDKVKKLKL
jgi:hypothetical protein